VKQPMLADKANLEKIQFPVYASHKLDGIRCAIKDDIAMSRKMLPIPNEFVQDQLGHSALNGLDGELTVGPANAPDLMQRCQSELMSQEGQPDFTYWVFDFWTAPDMPFGERYQIMQRAEKDGVFFGQTRVLLLPQTLIHNMAELAAFEAHALEQGYEGIMIRSPKGKYKYGRSTNREGYLLKLKPWVDAEAVVIGFVEGMHNDNEATIDETGYTKRSSHKDNMVPADTLGAFMCRDKAGVEFKVSCGVLTHPQRKQIWDERNTPQTKLGATVTFKTFKQTGVKDKPRFNIFKAFRDVRDM
jgi:DNA ligase-1